MSGDGQRWRVLLAEGGRSFWIEVDTGAGFRLATVVEVDQALKLTTYQVAERSAERNRNAEHPARFSERTSSMRRCVPFTSAYITPASATPTVITVPMIDAVSGFMLSSLCRVLMPLVGRQAVPPRGLFCAEGSLCSRSRRPGHRSTLMK